MADEYSKNDTYKWNGCSFEDLDVHLISNFDRIFEKIDLDVNLNGWNFEKATSFEYMFKLNKVFQNGGEPINWYVPKLSLGSFMF